MTNADIIVDLQHETRNPIMLCALELLAGGQVVSRVARNPITCREQKIFTFDRSISVTSPATEGVCTEEERDDRSSAGRIKCSRARLK